MKFALSLWALVLGLVSIARAETDGEGYAGIYVDAGGTERCAYVPPSKAVALYVMATLGDSAANGITGAEFRIEVSDPTGWYFSYTPPCGARVTGDPMDVDLDPNAGDGVSIAYSSCQRPLDGMVNLGSISVLNVGGNTIALRVKGRSTLANGCPLFVHCDAQAHRKVCMETLTEQPTRAASSRSRRASNTESAVFELQLNPTMVPEVPGESFTKTLDLGNSDLWVMGEQVTGPQATCSFDGSVLTIGSIPVPVSAAQMPQPTFTDDELMRTYRSVPAVQARMAAGLSVAQSVALYYADQEAVLNLARAARKTGGVDREAEVLRHSPLVERVELEGAHKTMKVRFKGFAWDFVSLDHDHGTSEHDRVASKPSLSELASRRVQTVEQALKRDSFQGSLVMVTHDGVARFSGSNRVQAKAQIQHVQEGRDLKALPPGPLRIEDYLKDISKVAKAKGRQ